MAKEDLPLTCHFGNCGRTDNLAQCPECHRLFCEKHDTHECIPQQQTVEQQEQIARIKHKRIRGSDIAVFGGIFLFVYGIFALLVFPDYVKDSLGLVSPEAYLIAVGILGLMMVVSIFVFGGIIESYYNYQLRKLGVHRRSIRP